jgi:hypothetical protein
MKFFSCSGLIAFAILPLFALPLPAKDQIPVRVVVVTTFQAGSDTDPTAGEFGNWVLICLCLTLSLSRKVTIPCVQP